MSTTPKQPCAPPLNLVPNGAAGSAFPPPLDETQLPIEDQNPGFGDLVTQLTGDAGDASDGFDAVVEAASALIGQADDAGAAQDAELDAILALLAQTDTTAVDNSFAGYLSTFDAGSSIVTGAQGLTTPDVTTGAPPWLPAPAAPPPGPGTAPGCKPGTVVGGVTIGKPDPSAVPTVPNIPGLVYHQVFNAMCLNDPKQDVIINEWTVSDDGTHWSSTTIWHDDPTIFSHYADDINRVGSTALRRGHLVVTPTKVGRFSFVIEFFGTDVTWLGKKQFDVTIVQGP